MTQSTSASHTYDVVIIGGGIAGLTAAYRLRDRNVLLLEKEDMPGGRTRSTPIGPYVYNRGAQFVPGPDTHVARLSSELGVQLTLIRKTKVPVHMNGRYIAASSNLSYLLSLPIPFSEKLRMGWQVLRMQRRYGRIVDRAPEAGNPLFRELSETTFADLMNMRHPDVIAHWDAVSMASSTLPSAEVAAFQPVNTFLHHAANEYFTEGGTGQLAKALCDQLGEKARLNATVTNVEPTAGNVKITYEQAGEASTVEAKECVVALPAPQAVQVLRNLPSSKRNALEQCQFGAMSTAAFPIDQPTGRIFGKGVWRIPVAGKSIIGISDPTFTYPSDMKQQSRLGLIRLYAGNAASQQLQQMPDDEALAVFENDLLDCFPAVRGHVIERVITHWPLALCPWKVGRLDIIDEVRRPHDNIHYCGDYTENSGLEAAVLSAERVVGEIAGSQPK